jgi:UDP-glucose 6-dehydrogenase
VTKSTVPVGTSRKVETIVKQSRPARISIVSNPEFLREGSRSNFGSPTASLWAATRQGTM